MILKIVCTPKEACRIGKDNVDRYLCLLSCLVPAVVSLSLTSRAVIGLCRVSSLCIVELDVYGRMYISRYRGVQQFGRLTCRKILVRATPLVSFQLQWVQAGDLMVTQASRLKRGFTQAPVAIALSLMADQS
jgi:hypothetical protein